VSSATKNAVCNHCTYKLVAIAYQRAPWFRLFREPLKLGMKWLVFWHQIDTEQYQVRTPGCRGCIRFYKMALFEKSSSFRWLHNQVNPVFNKLIAKIVTGEERRSAGAYAKAVSEGTLTEAEIAEWIKGLKTGL